MNRPALGRLERIEQLRDYWVDEARDFTPWLAQAENISLISQAIGIDLIVEAQEKSVGPFRADILCKDTLSGHFVLIENQLERTDHVHLGQLLTYAAGLDAVTVVWVAYRFAEEHRAALDWLNNVTGDKFKFFGLEIELWRIGASPPAPKFNIVSKPNDFTEVVRRNAAATSGSISDAQQLHLDFWTQFRRFMEDRNSPVRVNKPSTDAWTSIAVGRTNFVTYAVNGMRDGYSRVYLAITGPNAKAYFRQLETEFRTYVDERLGAVDWRELPNAVESQVSIRRVSQPSKRETWPELNQWFAETIENWVGIFRPIVRELTLPVTTAEGLLSELREPPVAISAAPPVEDHDRSV